MNSIGIVRKVDELGRIVIPIETRETLFIAIKDPLEIFIDEEANRKSLIFKKYLTGCIFCNVTDNCIPFKNKLICRNCLSEINQHSQ